MKGFIKLTKEQLDKVKGGINRPPILKYGVQPLYGITPTPLYGISA